MNCPFKKNKLKKLWSFIVQNLILIDDVSKLFLHVQSYSEQWVFFFQKSFFLIECALFLLKIRKDFNIDKIAKIYFFIHIWTYLFQLCFDFENYEIWKCLLKNIYSICVI